MSYEFLNVINVIHNIFNNNEDFEILDIINYMQNEKQILAYAELGKIQVVCWSWFSDENAAEILSSISDENRIMRLLNINYDAIFDTFKCKPHITNYIKNLFFQSYHEFQERNYNLSLCGLVVISDYLLSIVSKRSGTDYKKRFRKVINTVKSDAVFDKSNDISELGLFITTKYMLELYVGNIDYGESSNRNTLINRHLIMHGKRNISATKLDCMKLLNLIYGLLLLDEILDGE